MKNGKRTTYILLERDSEDIALEKEISKIFSKLGYKSVRELAKDFPMVLELKQQLQDEISNRNCFIEFIDT